MTILLYASILLRTRERDHVFLGEPLRCEEGSEVGEARRGRRDVVVGAAEAGSGGVPPPNLHVPVRPAKLHTHTQHARTYVTTLHSFQVRHLPLATYSVIQHCVLLTMTTLSLAAMATMSAHDTTPGHTFSTADLMASMTSNPLAEPLLGVAVFSPWKLGVSSSSNDASHPCVTYDDC
jgi:hypothetical protein